jgi:hypothetical protein
MEFKTAGGFSTDTNMMDVEVGHKVLGLFLDDVF